MLTDPEEETSSDADYDQDVPSEVLQGTALTSQDWHIAQSSDINTSLLTDGMKEGKPPSLNYNKQLDKQFPS